MHRTTVEITEAQWRTLIALASRRRERGFSRIVQEALDRFLEDERDQERKRHAVLALRGSWHGRRGDRLAEAAAGSRRGWTR